MSDLEPSQSGAPPGFKGTQVIDDGTGPVLLAHRQRLLVVDGPNRGLEIQVDSPRLTIGSASGNDVVLQDVAVSRHHCEITVRDEHYLLKDLGSTNGTLIGDTPVIEAYLKPGTRFRVGHTEILFEPRKKWVRVNQTDLDHFGGLYGNSPGMKSIFALLSKVAPTDLSCIVFGETGTGKELAARGIHDSSSRAGRPFIVVDCGAMSETLIESELFGHERGAFTGADRARAGAFELAHTGTVFLDEIGELPLDLQPKLLRVLERKEIKRLGAAKPLEVDVRVLAATHQNLPQMINNNKFREDLYYRLAEVVIEMPPLRARREDIPLIAKRILAEHADKWGKATSINEEALKHLISRKWAGNVRELRNVLRRAATLASASTLTVQDLVAPLGTRRSSVAPELASEHPTAPTQSADVHEHLPIKDARDRWLAPMEREYLARLVRRCGGDLDKASAEAGVHRKSFERLLRQHSLKVNEILADQSLDR